VQRHDSEELEAVGELVARYASKFAPAELTELAVRLLQSAETRDAWDIHLGEVVACAVYNGVGLAEAESLALRRQNAEST
jgi:hypothetical protein